MSTIIALSTPNGRGALAVIRLSGSQSLSITELLTGELHNVKPRSAALAWVKLDTGEMLDEVLITYFKGPGSVTGEDVVEISCHGSPAIVRRIIDLGLQHGARLAGPGEFSLRALSNGKINLAQAEAIRDLIAAQTEAAVKQAARQIGGELSTILGSYKKELIEAIVVLESALEFVEDDLPAAQFDAIEDTVRNVRDGIEQLSRSYSAGRLLQDGARVAIIGAPNVGKSSLFNKLIQIDRAIVTAIPGTTRDTLDHTIEIGGVPVILTDTAGLRETTDSIESLGIERTFRTVSDADLVLNVVDVSTPVVPVIPVSDCPEILVRNKCDLQVLRSDDEVKPGIKVSALTGEGLEELRAAILQSLSRVDGHHEGLLITNARHYDLLCAATKELDQAVESIEHRLSEELILASLHNALRLLGQITGETTSEDILSEIFSTFCIGK